MKPCIVCAFDFDHDLLGPKGCPNCHGRGLEPGIPRWSRHGRGLAADLADDMAALDRLQKGREAAAVDDSSRGRAFLTERQADQAWIEDLRARNLQATNLVKLKRAEVCEERLTAVVMGVMLVVLGLSVVWAVMR